MLCVINPSAINLAEMIIHGNFVNICTVSIDWLTRLEFFRFNIWTQDWMELNTLKNRLDKPDYCHLVIYDQLLYPASRSLSPTPQSTSRPTSSNPIPYEICRVPLHATSKDLYNSHWQAGSKCTIFSHFLNVLVSAASCKLPPPSTSFYE